MSVIFIAIIGGLFITGVLLIAVGLIAGNKRLSQADWYKMGVDQGYCTTWVCNTHDWIPMTEQEIESWEEGNDDCYWVVRIIEQEQD